jgi:hypothetical protein
MLKTIDVGLMANHLGAHKGVISRLELYMNFVKDPRLAQILLKQIGTMKNHVQVMNQLLNPNQNNSKVILAPIPQNVQVPNNQVDGMGVGIKDHDIALDAHFTAQAMANDNFISATNMKDPRVKRIHMEMAMQQSDIADQHEMHARQHGWLSHSDATIQEQSQAMSPLSQMNMMGNNPTAMRGLKYSNQNHIN